MKPKSSSKTFYGTFPLPRSSALAHGAAGLAVGHWVPYELWTCVDPV
jgi:hypothetical protein